MHIARRSLRPSKARNPSFDRLKLTLVPTSKRLNVAVVGATGMVGQVMLSILAERNFPSARVRALASERSKGLRVPYNGSSITIEPIDENAFKGVDVALFAASADIALMYAPIAAEAGALVIDNSSAWRMKDNVPLVVPEVNREDIRDNEGIIANPNCCAVPLTVVLNPLRNALVDEPTEIQLVSQALLFVVS